MKYAKILRLLALVLIIFSYIEAFEDKSSVSRRLNFYKNIKKYSNNTMTVGYSPDRGLFCVANDFIDYGRPTLKVPRKLSLCPYYLFPFKFEIVSYLKELQDLSKTVGQQQKFSVYVLTYYVLYFTSDFKDEVKKYIKENKLEQYYNIEETDDSLRDSFPKTIMNSAFFNQDHYILMQEMGFGMNKLSELEYVFNQMLNKVMKSEHMEAILPWVSDFHKFRWAYSIVMSRSMTLRLREYMVLDNTKEKMKNYSQWDKTNLELNKYISKNSGCPCIIAFIDLCNHHQPNYADLRDRRAIVLDTQKHNFINSAVKIYHKGEEITYTYVNEPNNAAMFLHYGFIIRNNIFDLVKVKIPHNTKFSIDQFNLCKELGCVDAAVGDPSKLPQSTEIALRLGQINEYLINYGRVKHLKSNFDYKKHFKILVKDEPLSYDNEISAWLFYFKYSKKTLNYDKLEKSIFKTQKYRNHCKDIQSNWKDNDKQRYTWMNYKTYETIYLMSLYYNKVMMQHAKLSLNKIIYQTKHELDNLRNKYLRE